MSAAPPPPDEADEGGGGNNDQGYPDDSYTDRGADPLENGAGYLVPDNAGNLGNESFDGLLQQRQQQQQQSIDDGQRQENDIRQNQPGTFTYSGTADMSGTSQQSYGDRGHQQQHQQHQQHQQLSLDGEEDGAGAAGAAGEEEEEEDAYEDPEEMIREFGRHPMMDRVQEALYNQLLQTYERVSEELRDKDADVKK